MPDRVMVFIDGSNLYHCVKDEFGRTDLDIGKLVDKLRGQRTLVRAYYYNTPPPPAQDPLTTSTQQKFYGALSWVPRLEIRWGKLLQRDRDYTCPECNHTHSVRTYVQKGVDTRLAIDLVTLAVRDTYDVGIIVSGDSDLVEAIRFVKEHPRKEVENAFTQKGWSPELRMIADTKTLIDSTFLSDCWIERPGKTKN